MTPAEIIVISGGVAGVADPFATGIIFRQQGVEFKRLLQFIASGVLGKSAFAGGSRTAALGVSLHFGIATLAALTYYALSNDLPRIKQHPLVSGFGFGTLLHLVMSQIVVPLSRTPPRPFSMKQFLIQLALHISCVGLPIAYIQAFAK